MGAPPGWDMPRLLVAAAGPESTMNSVFRGCFANGVAPGEPHDSGLGVGLVGENT